jgi:hypothetical protein
MIDAIRHTMKGENMSIDNAQSQAQPLWTKQNRSSICTPNATSEGGVGGVGGESGDIGFRATGAIGTQAVLVVQVTKAITGKILSRLVDRAEQRLNEAEECLVWYERQKQQATEELADLRSMIEELDKTEE